MTWTVAFYSDRLEAEILALAAGIVARFVRYAEKMEQYGPDLGMPHSRAMGGSLFELRIKAPEGLARVFYCTIVNRRIVFLHKFTKTSDKTPLKELQVARARMKEVKHG